MASGKKIIQKQNSNLVRPIESDFAYPLTPSERVSLQLLFTFKEQPMPLLNVLPNSSRTVKIQIKIFEGKIVLLRELDTLFQIIKKIIIIINVKCIQNQNLALGARSSWLLLL